MITANRVFPCKYGLMSIVLREDGLEKNLTLSFYLERKTYLYSKTGTVNITHFTTAIQICKSTTSVFGLSEIFGTEMLGHAKME